MAKRKIPTLYNGRIAVKPCPKTPQDKEILYKSRRGTAERRITMGYKMENIRNIAVMGHGKCGKSSLIEAMLFNCGAINRLGKSLDGTLAMDFEILF